MSRFYKTASNRIITSVFLVACLTLNVGYYASAQELDVPIGSSLSDTGQNDKTDGSSDTDGPKVRPGVGTSNVDSDSSHVTLSIGESNIKEKENKIKDHQIVITQQQIIDIKDISEMSHLGKSGFIDSKMADAIEDFQSSEYESQVEASLKTATSQLYLVQDNRYSDGCHSIVGYDNEQDEIVCVVGNNTDISHEFSLEILDELNQNLKVTIASCERLNGNMSSGNVLVSDKTAVTPKTALSLGDSRNETDKSTGSTEDSVDGVEDNLPQEGDTSTKLEIQVEPDQVVALSIITPFAAKEHRYYTVNHFKGSRSLTPAQQADLAKKVTFELYDVEKNMLYATGKLLTVLEDKSVLNTSEQDEIAAGESTYLIKWTYEESYTNSYNSVNWSSTDGYFKTFDGINKYNGNSDYGFLVVEKTVEGISMDSRWQMGGISAVNIDYPYNNTMDEDLDFDNNRFYINANSSNEAGNAFTKTYVIFNYAVPYGTFEINKITTTIGTGEECFVFKIEYSNGTEQRTFYETTASGNSIILTGLQDGTYTITEANDWLTEFKPNSQSYTVTVTDGVASKDKIIFFNERKQSYRRHSSVSAVNQFGSAPGRMYGPKGVE